MNTLNFIINEIFGQGAILLALIAVLGLILQKKSVEDIIRGTVMTAVGLFVLSQSTGIVIGNSIDGLASAFNTVLLQAFGTVDIDMSIYRTQVDIVILLAFAASLVFARFIEWRTVFLTGRMLYWFPYVFIAAGVDTGLIDGKLIGLAAVFTTAHVTISPNILFPCVKAVTGDSSFAIDHPTTCLLLLVGTITKFTGDKSHSTEDIKFPKSLNFPREVSITGFFATAVTYIMMFFILKGNGLNPDEIQEHAGGITGIFTYVFAKAIYFGMGVTILLLGVRILIAGIIPAFRGITEKAVPGAIPALDCPLLFPFTPNALTIGSIVAMITSTLMILLTAGMLPTVIVPLAFTCFFKIGCAVIISSARDGIRRCIVGIAVAGIVMIFLVGFDSYFFGHTINNQMLVYGGQDFSLWGIVEGLVVRLIS